MPNIVDPGPWIRERVAQETKPLRDELAATRSRVTRLRLRWRIFRTRARVQRLLGRGGPVRW
jgi:hypothetical protein